MRILVDTNILFSALVFPRSKPAQALLYVADNRPIFNAAIVSDVDIILTEDKDFLSLDIKHPKCMTVAQFLECEGIEG